MTRACLTDLAGDAVRALRLERPRLRQAALTLPPRRALVLAVERDDRPNLLAAARAELARSQHEVTFAATTAGDQGKFENLNRLLAEHDLSRYEWLLVLDDDVSLPRHFLGDFLFLAERFGLQLAQPAHRRRSHAAWAVTRRQAAAVVRETEFVEIGPVTAFRSDTFAALLPFPPLRFGWGLDAHWGALARANGWRVGVVDATAIRHGLRPIAADYDRSAAIAEARSFLAERPFLTRQEACRTLLTHRSWRAGPAARPAQPQAGRRREHP